MRIAIVVRPSVNERFGPNAFDRTIGTRVPFRAFGEEAEATVVDARVLTAGAEAELTLELNDHAAAGFRLREGLTFGGLSVSRVEAEPTASPSPRSGVE